MTVHDRDPAYGDRGFRRGCHDCDGRARDAAGAMNQRSAEAAAAANAVQ